MKTQGITYLTDVALITCIVATGHADLAISTAQSMGAPGATVYHARGWAPASVSACSASPSMRRKKWSACWWRPTTRTRCSRPLSHGRPGRPRCRHDLCDPGRESGHLHPSCHARTR